MKTLKTISTVILCIMTGLGSGLSAQKSDSANIKPPVFGFGFKVSQISLSDLFGNVMPGNKFLVTISPHKNLRLEGSFGYLSQEYESPRGTDLPGQSLFLGVSGFGMWQKGKTNFYGGLRLGFLNYSQEEEMSGYNNSTFEPYYYTQESTGSANSAGAVFGVEYFFSRHFTMGGEISLNSIKTENREPNQAGNPITSRSKTMMTETGLVTRFYF